MITDGSHKKNKTTIEDYDDGDEAKILFNNDEEVNAFRNRLHIKVKGSNLPNPMTSFKDIVMEKDLKICVLRNIESSQWKEPTSIQMQVIPVLAAGRDVLATAPTGSGKTGAFVIPALALLGKPGRGPIRVLFLAPTKELVDQTHREALRLCAGRRFRINVLKKAAIHNATVRQVGTDLSLLPQIDQTVPSYLM